jgi:predicted transcriptional regulator
MARLTIRLSAEKHERLRELAERRKTSMNKLIDELSTVALTEFDAETRFRGTSRSGISRKRTGAVGSPGSGGEEGGIRGSPSHDLTSHA